jgi:subtilisin family serine protease
VRLEVKDGVLVAGGRPKGPAAETLTGVRQHLEGHGTFIAGLLRQGCPEATIVSIPVMDGDGVAEEGDVLAALLALLDSHIAAQSGGDGHVVDVLSLSLGYYAEDETYTTGPVADVLRRFADHGVLVVAGVGNDASTNAFVPAALAADVPQPVKAGTTPPPLASVGAQNPGGDTIALFSNDLAHVSVYRPGVSLVSTVPPINGAGQASVSLGSATSPGPRTTLDPDDYTSGFALWSGTSFSTPIFAAELAAELVRGGDLTDVSDDAMRRRAVKALQTCLKGTRR